MLRILSKKMKGKDKKGISWTQMGRNRKLVGKAIADKLEITETFEELEKGVVIATSMFEKEFSIKVGGTA